MMGKIPARPVVLVALEPRTYREAIGGALAVMRPGLDVKMVEPAQASEEARASRPCLVLAAGDGGSHAPGSETLWVRISFGSGPRAFLQVGDGPVIEAGEFDLQDILELVDGAADPAYARSRNGSPSSAPKPRAAGTTFPPDVSSRHPARKHAPPGLHSWRPDAGIG